MVTARMPEDRSKTVKNRQEQLKTFKAIYTCMLQYLVLAEGGLWPAATCLDRPPTPAHRP
eukprot:1587377-Heterocapsa_arctica.AAC.1